MSRNQKPELEPSKEPLPVEPILDPKPRVAPEAWEISASKKVDDISRHESKHDDSDGAKQGLKPKPEHEHQPASPQQPGGKPGPGKDKA